LDGKGAGWAWHKLKQKSGFNGLLNFNTKLPIILSNIVFLIIFGVELVINIFTGFYSLVIKKGEFKGEPEIILGRDYTYDLLKIANEKKWTVGIVGGWKGKKTELNKKLKAKYKNLKIKHESFDPDSNLMKDEFARVENKNKYLTKLTEHNLYDLFPELLRAKKYFQKNKCDIILVCLGGKSGKQEFFVNDLQKDSKISFRLATGIGAALDHLGAGSEQKPAPLIFQTIGLEWMWRFFILPQRRGRIVDSILKFWFWISLQNLVSCLPNRPTIVNIVKFKKKGEKDQFLLVKNHESLIPGDLAWSFVQGGIENLTKVEKLIIDNEPEDSIKFKFLEKKIIQNGLRELQEEVRIKAPKNSITQFGYLGSSPTSVSLRRTLFLHSRFYFQQVWYMYSEVKVKYKPKTNWENQSAEWVEAENLETLLRPTKYQIWLEVQKAGKKSSS
jgi:exopolysaccharide biosynthesis WecB/TagA/CpsF family protein